MDLSVESSIEFARSLELPEFEDFGLESIDEAELPQFDKPDLAVTVGSQIASFANDVDPDLRERISNGFLFAQQAANKQISDPAEASTLKWYNTYVNVLTQIGWQSEEHGAVTKVIKGTSLQVHKEITEIVSAALGPAVASLAMIVKVLEGLNQMDANAPWITLFSRESQRAEANQFQMSHVDKVDGKPRITLVNFELAAERSVTKVLFFKLDSNKAELRHTPRRVSVNEPIFSQVAPVIADRLADRVRRFVMEIEI